jgi:hypothetical protein
LERERRKKINMKRFFYFAVIVSAAVLFFSCTKVGAGEEEDINAIDQNDDVFPVITTTKPTPNQVYVSGDSIIVEGNVTDEKLMYKGKVQIKNDANGFMVAENYYETHFLKTINYRLAYKAIVTAPTDFSVILEFQDHGANTVTATTKVKVNP